MMMRFVVSVGEGCDVDMLVVAAVLVGEGEGWCLVLL
jgi:hypothetical protein